MREPVVITEVSYTKGQRVFDRHKDTIEWILTEPEEPAVSQAVRKNRARITVLSVEPYRSDLYIALSEVAGDRPALIARFGVGFDSIDTKLCLKHNVYLTITPGTLDQSVAEHTIALLLSLVRHISVLDRDMHAGKYSPMRGIELRGKPLGVAGFGRIGKRVAQIAARAAVRRRPDRAERKDRDPFHDHLTRKDRRATAWPRRAGLLWAGRGRGGKSENRGL